MKKVLMVLFVLAMVSTVSTAEIIVKGGYSLASQTTVKVTFSDDYGHEASVEDTGDTEGVVQGSIEYYLKGKTVQVGFGAAYEPETKVKSSNGNTSDMGCSFIPVYGALKLNINNDSDNQLYMVGKLGYGLTQWKDKKPAGFKEGLFYGAGGGLRYDIAVLEVLYSVNNGETNDSVYIDNTLIHANLKLSYPKVSLSAGLVF